MRILFLFSLFCLFSACGQHSQELTRVESKQPVKNAGETDQKLILLNAVNSGDLATVHELAEDGADLNIRNNEGLTLIMIAIRAQQFAVVEYLVAEEVDLEMVTESEDYNPDVNARQFVESLSMDLEVKGIVSGILNQEPFDTESLGSFMYSAITFKNVDLLRWLLDKGVDPNFIRHSSSGRPKDSPLIYLFSLRGVEGDEFQKLTEIFDLLVSHPDIDVNLKVRRSTPLRKAKRRLQSDPAYQPLVDTLINLGAQ